MVGQLGHQFDRAYVSPFSKLCLFLNEQWQTLQMSEAVSLQRGNVFTLSSSRWVLVKNDLPDVNDHWFSCDCLRPKGARHLWGRPVKCLGLNAGVSFALPTPSPLLLIFRSRMQFRSLRVFFGNVCYAG